MNFSQRFPPYNHVQLQLTMYSLIKKSIRRGSTETSCTKFRQDFDYWFRCGFPLFPLYGLYIRKNLLPLVNSVITKLELFLGHICLTIFEKILRWNEIRCKCFISKQMESNSYWNKYQYTKSGKLSVHVPNGRLLSITGGGAGLSENGVSEGEFSLSSSSSSRMEFSASPRIS